MKSIDKTQKQLLIENKELRGRLNEAEETLRAIRSGDWDALVVSGADGEQIFTLRQSELRYRRLFEAAQDGILLLDAMTGAIKDVNPFLIKMLGYSREEFIEKKLWEVGAFKDVEASQKAFEALQQNEYIRYENLPLKMKNGQLVQVEFVSNVYLVDDEKVIQCNIRDITQRKHIEDALRESEIRYRAIFESSQDAVLLTDPNGSILDVNPATCQMFGRSVEEIKRLGRNALVDVTDPRLAAALEERARTGKATSELTMMRANGSKFPADVTSTAFTDALGQMRTSMIIRDITVRKQAEDALRESEERYRLLMETLPDGVVVHSQGRVIFANPASAKLIGAASTDELIGKAVMDFIHPDYREMVLNRIQQSLSDGLPLALMEEKFLRQDGISIDVEVSAIPFFYAGKPAMLTVFNDIRARLRAEQALRESEQHYRQIIETAGEGIWTIDDANQTTLVNQHLADMLGYTIEEMIGKSVYDFMDEEGKIIAATSLENRRQGINEQLDFKYKHKNGSTVWTLIETSTLLDHNQQYIGALAMLTDITRRKQIETEMRQRLNELEVLYQGGLAFSQLIDPDPKTIAEKIIDLLNLKMDWHHTAIRLYHPENETLELLAFNVPNVNTRAEHSAAKERLKIMQRPDQGLSGWAIRHRRPVRCNDLKNDVRYFENFPGLQSGLYVPIKIAERVLGIISIESEFVDHFSESDERLISTLAAQAAIALENADLFNSLKRSNSDLISAYDATIEGWSRALDLRDKETEGHSQRVTEMTLKLARACGLSGDELAQLRWGSLLHDIGKMGVPDGILLKPGSLTDEEWVTMKKHPAFAYEMLFPIQYLRGALDIPYCHHEKWDGSGYPRALKGKLIPLSARIFAVVDVYDALSSDRPYRDAWPKEKVREHIHSLAGTHFDPALVEIFLQILD